MARPFRVQIIGQDGVDYQGEAVYVRVPGHDGYFGVMAHHTPMIAQVDIGEVKVVGEGDEVLFFAVSGGISHVKDNCLTLLVRSAEAATEISIERAEEAAARAQQRLQQARERSDIDGERARFALLRALNRLKVARRLQS